MAAAREAADAAVAGHSATEVVRGKEHWLYFTHPERPVAGAQVAIYFNNKRLRHPQVRTQICCTYRANPHASICKVPRSAPSTSVTF